MSASKTTGLAVILLLSDDTDRLAGFYRDVLGLDLLAEEHGGRQRHYGCRLGSLYLTIQSTGDFPGTRHATDHDPIQLCFTTQSMDDFLRHLDEVNVKPQHSPRPFEQTVFVTLRDPDGRAVRVMTPWGK